MVETVFVMLSKPCMPGLCVWTSGLVVCGTNAQCLTEKKKKRVQLRVSYKWCTSAYVCNVYRNTNKIAQIKKNTNKQTNTNKSTQVMLLPDWAPATAPEGAAGAQTPVLLVVQGMRCHRDHNAAPHLQHDWHCHPGCGHMWARGRSYVCLTAPMTYT